MSNPSRSNVADQVASTSTTSTTTNSPPCACPECDAAISFDRPPLGGQIVRCPDCASELEVTSVAPVRLELAPEVEEDWGE
jgi:alpha-aminoadipate carrier protein LysW